MTKKSEPILVETPIEAVTFNDWKPFLDKQTGELTVPNPRAVKTQYNREQFPNYHEENTLPSLTVPNQTMSIKDLLDRHKRGLPLHGNLHPVYHGDEEMPDLRRMDLSEIQALKEYNEGIIFEETEKTRKAEKAAADKKREELFNQEVEKRLNAKQTKNPTHDKSSDKQSLPQ